MHEGPGSMPSTAFKKKKKKETGMVVHICNPSNGGREPRGSEVHPLIQSDFEVSQLNAQSRPTSSG